MPGKWIVFDGNLARKNLSTDTPYYVLVPSVLSLIIAVARVVLNWIGSCVAVLL